MSDPRTLLRLLQVTDSGFPIGAFAFSHGLEGLFAAGIVRDERDIAAFVALHLNEGFAGIECPAMLWSWRAVRGGDLAALLELDGLVDALKPVPAFRSGSVRTGRGLMRSAAGVVEGALLGAYRARVAASGTPGHHAVAFGAVMACAGVDESTASLALGISFVGGLTAAAVRLGIIGQGAAQRIVAGAHDAIAAAAARARDTPREDMGAFMPIVDVAGLRQPRLPGRIFAS